MKVIKEQYALPGDRDMLRIPNFNGREFKTERHGNSSMKYTAKGRELNNRYFVKQHNRISLLECRN